MNCTDFRSIAVHTLLGKATPEQTLACRRHVEGCAACAADSKANAYVVDLLRDARVPKTSAGFRKKLAQRFDLEIGDGGADDSDRYLRITSFTWRERVEAELAWIGYRLQNSRGLQAFAAAAVLLVVTLIGIAIATAISAKGKVDGDRLLPPDYVKVETPSRGRDWAVPGEVVRSDPSHVVVPPGAIPRVRAPRPKAPEIPDVAAPEGSDPTTHTGRSGAIAGYSKPDRAPESSFELEQKLHEGRPSPLSERDKQILVSLRWLTESQDPDGSFDPARSGGMAALRVGATGLVTLGLLSNKNRGIPSSLYRQSVTKAIAYLRQSMARDSTLGRVTGLGERNFEYTLFNHALATAALAKHALVMGDHEDEALLREALLRLADLSKQREPGSVSAADATTAPWVAFALETARAAGVRPEFDLADATHRARSFLITLADPSATRRGITAVAMVGPQAAASAFESEFGRAASAPVPPTPSVLIEHLKRAEYREPTKIFFAAFDLHSRGGDAWSRWEKAADEVLLPSRHDDGRFSTGEYRFDWVSEAGGDLYTTALAVLALSVN